MLRPWWLWPVVMSAVLSAGAHAATVRFATFNVAMNRPAQGELMGDLASGDDAQIAAVAEIIQRVNPDVILLNEFDYETREEGRRAVELFQQNYLGVVHHGSEPIRFGHVFVGRSNTGVHTGHDLDGNGRVTGEAGSRDYGGDCKGYGAFPGQYNMVLLSKYPIAVDDVRTFGGFPWKDMPGAALPDDAATPGPADFYTDAELAELPLSSKSHWDVPVRIGGGVVHVLCAHPTPPVFDGAEDRNGRRNHDEIRLWADYITAGKGGYIVDDKGESGGLAQGAAFVILGDLNADPDDGGSHDRAIHQLLGSALVNTTITPASAGGTAAAARQGGVNAAHKGDPAHDTADFTDLPVGRAGGNMRVDYALPSATLSLSGAGVFWPAPGEVHSGLVGAGEPERGGEIVSSDHRLVWVDVEARETERQRDEETE